jgi:hypothetical protein
MLNSKVLFLIILILYSFSIGRKKKIQILPLYPYEFRSARNPHDSILEKFYFIDGFTSYDQDSVELDNFIKEHIDTNYTKYFDYSINFYKKSNLINENYRNPSSDNENINIQLQLIKYLWMNGEFHYCVVHSTPIGESYFKSGSKLFNSTIKHDSHEDNRIQVTDVRLEDSNEVRK